MSFTLLLKGCNYVCIILSLYNYVIVCHYVDLHTVSIAAKCKTINVAPHPKNPAILQLHCLRFHLCYVVAGIAPSV